MKFTKKELQRLECFTEEDINIILEYQKRLPVLTENDDNDCWINSRDLWKQLGVNSDYSHWFKKQTEALDLIENVGYNPLAFKDERVISEGGANRIDYLIKLSTGKEIALIAGIKGGRTSKELIENSKLARKYFLLMEKAVKENINWWQVRDPEKAKYKEMCDALDTFLMKTANRPAKKVDYAQEADLLNVLITGKKAKDLRVIYVIPLNELVRDYLKKDYNEELLYLEERNIELLSIGMNFEQRKEILTKMYNSYMERKGRLSA